MIELKARHIVDVYDSYYAENPFGERSQVYLKSEADKVIAELGKNLSEIQSQKMQLEDDVALLRRNNAELKEERRWRKCSEEKPDEEQFVLAWLTEDGKRGFFLTSYFIGGKFLIGEDPHGCKPTYWMPLPSDPKEEK